MWIKTIGILFLSLTANAQGTSTIASPLKNSTYLENNEITDPKLRADGGSLSRYSLKFNLNYAGPTVGDLSAKDQPNPDGTVGSFQTSLSGNVGVRYRLSTRSTVGVASGLKAIYPMHGVERWDMSNPSLTYDYSWRAFGVQMKNSSGVILRTVPEFQKVGQYGYFLDNYSLVYNIGDSAFSIGSDFAMGIFLYNRDYQKGDGKAARYSFELNPNIKYSFSDQLNLILASNISLWNPRSREDQYALLNRSVNQRIGMGYAYDRDIYLNPYITFFAQNVSMSSVTLNFSTVFSVF